MNAEQPVQPGRRRRAHKRSRKGCLTCKQRHIRCDERKPVCTNCLVRGGDCGYPELATGSSSGTTSASGAVLSTNQLARQLGQQFSHTPSATPAGPFDVLPVEMPHRSMELFHHFTHYRVLSRFAVPKSRDCTCVGIAIHGPGTFRACLLLAAMHYSWMEGSLATMEETYLYHKVEAMRLVNEQIGDPVLSTSDGCINTIAALALTESSIGDVEAAEAHLNGLYTLLNIWRHDEWQHRFYGIIQRVALVAGSFISAAKTPEDDELEQYPGGQPREEHSRQHYIRPTGPLLSAGPFKATNLSPFYIGSPPDMEACKSDAEEFVMINALRRLSSLPIMTGRMARYGGIESHESSLRNSPEPLEMYGVPQLSPKQTAILLGDADSYIASLLFKPTPIFHDPMTGMKLTRSPSPEDSSSANPDRFSQSHSRSRTHRATRESRTPNVQPNPSADPYPKLDAAIFPSASRAWAVAAHLYLHMVLDHLWVPPRPVDTNFLHLLLDRLRDYIMRTEEAMKIGAYSRDLWLWSVVVGGYALTAVRDPPSIRRAAIVAMSSGMQDGIWGVGERGEFDLRRKMAASTGKQKQKMGTTKAAGELKPRRTTVAAGPPNKDLETLSRAIENVLPRAKASHMLEQSDEDEEDDDEEEEEDDNNEDDDDEDYEYDDDDGEDRTKESDTTLLWQPGQRQESVAEIRAWFEERLGVWSRFTKITSWEEVKIALLRVAWLEDFQGEALLAQMWGDAVHCDGMVNPFAALDPNLR